MKAALNPTQAYTAGFAFGMVGATARALGADGSDAGVVAADEVEAAGAAGKLGLAFGANPAAAVNGFSRRPV